jgi:plasmid stabilization system protein ParE
MVSRFANSHQIRISTVAAKDILEIYDYVVEFDSEANADRLVYLVNEKFVTINAVLDGRRNLQTLLSRRLLRL